MIQFWKVNEPYGYMSNWYLTRFTYKDVEFISSEQALMWSKAVIFGDKETANKISKETNQRKIKELGRQVQGYNDEEWSSVRYNIMVTILMEKFNQNLELKKKLLETGDEQIFEASPVDGIWGIKSIDANVKIDGENLLGKALMEVRSLI